MRRSESRSRSCDGCGVWGMVVLTTLLGIIAVGHILVHLNIVLVVALVVIRSRNCDGSIFERRGQGPGQ